MAINIKYPLRDIISLSSFDRAITKKITKRFNYLEAK